MNPCPDNAQGPDGSRGIVLFDMLGDVIEVGQEIAVELPGAPAAVALLAPDGLDNAILHFERAVEVFPSAANPAVCRLAHSYRAAGEEQKRRHVVSRLAAACD